PCIRPLLEERLPVISPINSEGMVTSILTIGSNVKYFLTFVKANRKCQ
ncbi:hypothetical protein LCGC14_3068820, partial [marine sediment metagenome]